MAPHNTNSANSKIVNVPGGVKNVLFSASRAKPLLRSTHPSDDTSVAGDPADIQSTLTARASVVSISFPNKSCLTN